MDRNTIKIHKILSITLRILHTSDYIETYIVGETII